MAYLFPRFAYTPAVCCAAPSFRHEFSPLFSLFDDTIREINAVARSARHKGLPLNPRFDVKEDKEAYVLEGEVPGFKESDLSIEWNDSTLAIRGRHESSVESGNPQAKTIDDTPVSDANSVKSHQATVEDEDEASANKVEAENKGKQVEEIASDVQPEQEQQQVTTTQSAQPSQQHWVSERTTGEFLRQFSFPSNAVNQEAIKASLESGILRIIVPKLEQQPSRTINIE